MFPAISKPKAQVVFQFPKEYLEKADAGTVENAIGEVFSIGNDTQAQSNQPQGQRAGTTAQAQRGQAQQKQPAQTGSKPNPNRTRFSWDTARMKFKQPWASRKRL
ncbi:MAG TPA: hypothetical protein VN901_12785 [Candidatus Acidoferrales bacterium]|nr:hypothetical protein [Candidatus Acidoferrales bacterium]